MSQFAAVIAALNDIPRAGDLYRLLRPYAGLVAMASPGVACYGSISHALGLLAATLCRGGLAGIGEQQPSWDDVERHFQDALAAHTRMGARALLARTRYAYATMLLDRIRAEQDRGGGRVSRAADLLDRAAQTARELEMERLAGEVERAWVAIEALGPQAAPPRAAAAPFPDALTAREVDILRQVATGRSNREIADYYVLSVRTVERHIANIYAKIGAHSKAEATAYAFRHTLL
jgi:DNA-binding CsgD family transcriptional regulator